VHQPREQPSEQREAHDSHLHDCPLSVRELDVGGSLLSADGKRAVRTARSDENDALLALPARLVAGRLYQCAIASVTVATTGETVSLTTRALLWTPTFGHTSADRREPAVSSSFSV
jgi:hypothetical protein